MNNHEGQLADREGRDSTVRFGRRPVCTVCGLGKAPIGRSTPLGSCYCDFECPGYREEPLPDTLFPGEPSRELAEEEGWEG